MFKAREKLLSEVHPIPTDLIARIVDEMRQELFQCGDHPALGVPTEIVERWLAALVSTPGTPAPIKEGQ